MPDLLPRAEVAALSPLPIHPDHWRSRWLQVYPRGQRLHRVAIIEWWLQEDGAMIRGEGTAVCGVTGFLHMPGIFSRMGAPRCPKCCKALGIPSGKGAPGNSKEAWRDA